MVCPKCQSEKVTKLKSGRNVCQDCKFVFGEKAEEQAKLRKNLIKLARQGDINALSSLLNDQLNLTVRVFLNRKRYLVNQELS